MKTTITIGGTHCPSCKALLEDVCRDFPEIQSCSVDYHSGQTVIEHDEHLDWQRLKEEIERAGSYSVELPIS